MFCSFKYSLAAILILLTLAGSAALAALPTIMEEKDVLPYLEQMISWHRRGTALEVWRKLPAELIHKTTLQNHAPRALNDISPSARALAKILPGAPKPAATED